MKTLASILAVLAALAVAGCGTTTIVTTAPASKPGGARHELSIGDGATLKGEKPDEDLYVTLLAYKETISSGEYDTPEEGMKYVGVTLKLTNIGTVPYSDAPSNGATILGPTGRQGKSAVIESGECSEGFAVSVKIAPGESQEGCIPFEIPQDETAAKLQWTPSSGFGEETAEWSLTQPQKTAARPPAINNSASHVAEHGLELTPAAAAHKHALEHKEEVLKKQAVERREHEEAEQQHATPTQPAPRVAVPNLEGAAEAAAMAALARLGLMVHKISRPTGEQAQVGVVLEQTPPPGANIRKGATVLIAVGVLAPETTPTTSTPTTSTPTTTTSTTTTPAAPAVP